MSESTYPFKIDSKPEFAFLTVQIPANQSLMVEASAMADMDSHIQMKTKMKGGLKRLVSRESIFINEFSSPGGPGMIGIAPGPAGDIAHFAVSESNKIYLTGSAYVASTPEVIVDTKWQGIAKGFFSGESLFLMYCHGQGDLWFNTYGAIFSVDVKGEYIVDTGHIVAFTDGLDYHISKVGGYKSLFFSGEGLVCRFQGEGQVFIQTRNPLSLVGWADAYRRVQSSN